MPRHRQKRASLTEHICPILSPVSQKSGLIRKSFRISKDQDVLWRYFNSFIPPCLEYCSPIWPSAADSHLKLLDKNLQTCKSLIPNLNLSLQHQLSINLPCMLYNVFHTVTFCILSILSFPTCSIQREPLELVSVNSLSFSDLRFNTSQYPRCFIPATTTLWNDLPSIITEAL